MPARDVRRDGVRDREEMLQRQLTVGGLDVTQSADTHNSGEHTAVTQTTIKHTTTKQTTIKQPTKQMPISVLRSTIQSNGKPVQTISGGTKEGHQCRVLMQNFVVQPYMFKDSSLDGDIKVRDRQAGQLASGKRTNFKRQMSLPAYKQQSSQPTYRKSSLKDKRREFKRQMSQTSEGARSRLSVELQMRQKIYERKYSNAGPVPWSQKRPSITAGTEKKHKKKTKLNKIGNWVRGYDAYGNKLPSPCSVFQKSTSWAFKTADGSFKEVRGRSKGSALMVVLCVIGLMLSL